METLQEMSAKKENTKSLFRQKPPIELVNKVLKHMGIEHGLTDARTFTKEDLSDKEIEEWIPELEAYYYPCKARRFLDHSTKENFITIIRHIIRVHNFDLRTQERVIGGIKKTQYQIEPKTPSFQSRSGIFIEFN
jgi:hypothetical protein